MRFDRWFLLASGVFPLALFVIKTSLQAWTLANILAADMKATYPILLVVYAIYQVRKWRAGRPMNVPKLLLLAALVPLQWLAFGYAARFGPDGIVRAGIALGLFHSLQYHRLMWFHNKNRYQFPDARAKHGLAAVLAQKFGYYFAAAAGLYVIAEVLPQTLFSAAWLPAALWGVAFMHYLLDSKIWRVRGDKELAAALRM
jgi:ammonia channel protein AmtB